MGYEDFIGRSYPEFSIEVEKGRIAQFAAAIGEHNPIYRDSDAAREAGYAAIPAPPTFAYSITMDAGQSFNILEDMGIDRTRAVHGEQGFAYRKPIVAGDVITGKQTITNVFEKKGGALTFIIAEIALTNQNGEAVCDLTSTVVVRND